jgi:amino acid transporter
MDVVRSDAGNGTCGKAAAPAGRLPRELGMPGLALFGMAAIGPGSAMAVWGEISQATQGASVLAYAVGLVAMLAVAHGYATLAREMPSAGSAFAFATARLGPTAGFAAGWLLLLDYLLVPSLSALFGAVALQSLWPAAPRVAFVVLLIASAVACNLAGVRVSVRWLLAALIGTLGVVTWFSVLAFQRLGAGEGSALSLAPLWPPGGPSMPLVLGSVSIATLSYLGFDAISVMSEDARNPQRDVPRATLLALVLCGLSFVLVVWLAEDLSRGFAATENADAAFYELARRIGGAGLATAVGMTMVVGTFPAALAGQSAMARVMMAMARAGVLPSQLARIHARSGSPALATLLGGAGALTVALIFADQMAALVKLVSIGAMGAFALVEMSLLRSACRGWRAYVSRRVVPALGLAVLGVVVWNMDSNSHIVALAWLACGALVYASGFRRAGRST